MKGFRRNQAKLDAKSETTVLVLLLVVVLDLLSVGRIGDEGSSSLQSARRIRTELELLSPATLR